MHRYLGISDSFLFDLVAMALNKQKPDAHVIW